MINQNLYFNCTFRIFTGNYLNLATSQAKGFSIFFFAYTTKGRKRVNIGFSSTSQNKNSNKKIKIYEIFYTPTRNSFS